MLDDDHIIPANADATTDTAAICLLTNFTMTTSTVGMKKRSQPDACQRSPGREMKERLKIERDYRKRLQ